MGKGAGKISLEKLHRKERLVGLASSLKNAHLGARGGKNVNKM